MVCKILIFTPQLVYLLKEVAGSIQKDCSPPAPLSSAQATVQTVWSMEYSGAGRILLWRLLLLAWNPCLMETECGKKKPSEVFCSEHVWFRVIRWKGLRMIHLHFVFVMGTMKGGFKWTVLVLSGIFHLLEQKLSQVVGKGKEQLKTISCFLKKSLRPSRMLHFRHWAYFVPCK